MIITPNKVNFEIIFGRETRIPSWTHHIRLYASNLKSFELVFGKKWTLSSKAHAVSLSLLLTISRSILLIIFLRCSVTIVTVVNSWWLVTWAHRSESWLGYQPLPSIIYLRLWLYLQYHYIFNVFMTFVRYVCLWLLIHFHPLI